MKRTLRLLLAAITVGAVSLHPAHAVFDPVGEDTDIFLANPTYTATKPNVLVMMDNTANWNNVFTAEISALQATADATLNDNFRVGLGFFPETGNPNDNVDGAYIRFGVRTMDATNKAALKQIISNLDQTADKGNNATFSLMMYEAYAYFAGIDSRSGHGKIKRDAAGNTTGNSVAAPLPGNPLDSTSAVRYTSPIQDSCQKNFIVVISNGPANDNQSSLSTAESLLAGLTGQSPPSTIAISPNGEQNNWMDEYAHFMAENDCNSFFSGTQSVTTYTIDIRQRSQSTDLAHSALLQSAAVNGKGKYILIDTTVAGVDVQAELKAALQSIFDEIQAVNSIFASVTLPVSVNVRGTNLNQVYIGVFRPDAQRKPRWFGNLKLYNLGVTTSGVLFLADATGARAENPDTGFITNTAQSFWTTALTGANEFWSFRTPFDVSDIGQGKDLPDGDLVEKGGAAQRLREVYKLSQTARNVYTCIGTSDCLTGHALSTMPFTTANTNILASDLKTFNTKSVTSLTSSGQIATATVVAHGYTVGQTIVISGASPSIYNGTFTISAVTTDTFSYDMGATPSGLIAQVNASNHKMQTGDTVVVSLAQDSAFNTTSSGASITVPTGDANTFSYDISTAPITSPSLSQSVVGKRNVTQLYSIGSTATVTLPNHQFAVTPTVSTVSIEGAAESEYNLSNVSITAVDGNTFTYPLSSIPSKASRAVQVTTTSPHGFSTGDTITVAGTTNSAYNGAFVITRVGASQFTYSVTSDLTADATGGTATRAGSSLSVTSMSHASGSGTVNVTTSAAHNLVVGSSVTIAGSTYPQYNGTFSVTAVGSGTTFSFSPTTPPAISAATTPATGAISATCVTGVSGGCTAGMLRSVVSVTHPTSGNTTNQNTATVQTTASPSGFKTGDLVTISGASQAAYNGTWTVTGTGSGANANTFTIVNDGTASSWPTPAAGTITAGTAVTIPISVLNRVIQATNSTTNGPIRVVRTLSASSIATQTQASGTITVANTADVNSTERDLVINWVRGEENNEDEDLNEAAGATNNRYPTLTGTPFTVRSSIHGDVLHSRPAVVNYSRDGSDNDVYIFYGANDGLLHAIKGGFATSANSTLNPGEEAWSFVASEFYGKLKRLRDDSPSVTGTSRRDYFFDGPIGAYTLDVGSDGKLTAADGDKVYMYIGMRRGGRMLYALDVSDPENPKFMWKIGCPNMTNNTGCTAGFEEMGETWSEPKVGWIRANTSHPVLIFGAGYDPGVEDFHPCLVTASSASAVTAKIGGSVTFTSTGDCSSTVTSGTPTDRGMGRGIYVVDAVDGTLIRYIGGGTTTSTNKTVVSAMSYAMASDVTVLNRDRDTNAHGTVTGRENVGRGFLDRVYAPDTGGNVWRIDIDNADPASWVVTRLASISDASTVSASDTRPAGTRKFLFAPDIVFTSDANGAFDAVLLGSGDREHPFDTLIQNRFYMFKDRKTGLDATGQGDTTTPAITESDLFDVTNDCLQATTSTCSATQQAQAQADLLAAKGWMLTFLAGEKTVSAATTLAGSTFFNTNQPSSVSDASCSSNLGIAREYAVSYKDATATLDLSAGGGITSTDRFAVHAGGGYLPSPVPVIVQIGDQKYQAVISGTSVESPGGLTLEHRLRTYWYRKVE